LQTREFDASLQVRAQFRVPIMVSTHWARNFDAIASRPVTQATKRVLDRQKEGPEAPGVGVTGRR
jgi:hypothetical protein